MDDQNQQDKKRDRHRTIASLRLNLEEAQKGRTWLLLPEGFRASQCGKTYPLPSRRLELQKLVAIYIPKNKRDSGCVYLRRALDKWKEQQARASSALLDMGRREERIKESHYNYQQFIRKCKEDARKAVDEVREETGQAIANLNDLFDLSRKGINEQMKAHLEGRKWQGEKINARAFRECFRMVTQAVKGLGLPSDQRAKADEAIMEEVAASLKDTREAVAFGRGGDGEETEH